MENTVDIMKAIIEIIFTQEIFEGVIKIRKIGTEEWRILSDEERKVFNVERHQDYEFIVERKN